jgi:hypothetical protein
MANKLTLYEEYSREEVHDILSPKTKFTKSSGTWGLQGIIKIYKEINDYVFFVTIGGKQSNHSFKEGIDKEGYLHWQSQPHQDFKSTIIKELISHDYKKNSIFLFLRKNKKTNYQFLGKLKYNQHHPIKIKPIYFTWKLIDFNLQVFKKNNLIDNTLIQDNLLIKKDQNSLTLRDSPISINRNKPVDLEKAGFVPFEEIFFENQRLGKAGEELVLIYERENLNKIGRQDLAEKVALTRDFLGNNAKYDVKSYNSDGSVKYIEVKTTKSNERNVFYISDGEIRFSEEYSDNYYLYRVYNFVEENKSAEFFVLKGKINRKNVKPQNYKYSLNEDQ